MFKIATLLQACLGLHHPEIYPILVLMHSRFKKGVLPIIRLPAEAIKFAPAYFFCRRKYKWTSKMIWRSFDNLKKPPRLLYAFSFDGYQMIKYNMLIGLTQQGTRFRCLSQLILAVPAIESGVKLIHTNHIL